MNFNLNTFVIYISWYDFLFDNKIDIPLTFLTLLLYHFFLIFNLKYLRTKTIKGDFKRFIFTFDEMLKTLVVAIRNRRTKNTTAPSKQAAMTPMNDFSVL